MTILYRWFDFLRHRGRLRRWLPAQAWGRHGEDLAHRYLRSRGYVIVARNWRTRTGAGELDLIAWQGSKLVFVEVKARESVEYGAPEDAVDAEKRRHLRRAAGEFLRRTGIPWEQARFDLVSVVYGVPPSISHIEDAFGRLSV